MYWSRTGSYLDVLIWLALSALWAAGGWLLAVYLFHSRPKQSAPIGLAIGLTTFITLTNLFTNFITLTAAYWVSALLLAFSGLVSWLRARRQTRTPGPLSGALRGWRYMLALLLLTVLLTGINRGLSIFDDYHNLPLVSTIAAGDAPPHFYLDPQNRLAYHYGLHLFAASLVRLAGLFPWSALDFSKAFVMALTLVLAWIWFRRLTGKLGAWLGTTLLFFGGGARWLLLFAPAAWLQQVSQHLSYLGSGAASGSNLLSSLSQPWAIEGAGSVPFPFAYANGIFPPMLMDLGGSSTLPWLAIFLLLLIWQRQWRIPQALIFTLILASLALTGEHLFLMVVAGLILALFLLKISARSSMNPATPPQKMPPSLFERTLAWLRFSAILLLPALLLAFSAGGVLTEIARQQLSHWFASSEPAMIGFAGFSFHLRPVVVSAHLGSLSVFDPNQLAIVLAESGPVLFLAPAAIAYSWRRARRGDWLTCGLGIASLIGLLVSLFITYGVPRDIIRFMTSTLTFWIILAFPFLWHLFKVKGKWLRDLLAAGYLIAIFGGLALFATQVLTIPAPQLAYFVHKDLDDVASDLYWDRLPQDAQVLDSIPFRAVTLFGRPSRAHMSLYEPYPDWDQRIKSPDPVAVAQAGYGYVYMDRAWWKGIDIHIRQAFETGCSELIMQRKDQFGDYRRLYDVRGCR
ncbi:MAG: hypothetical protein P8074_18160 [Anaerolineales bacterium]